MKTTVAVIAGFLLGVVASCLIHRFQKECVIQVPFRHGDRVMVRSGFLAGRIGKLVAREKYDVPPEPKYRIDFDDEKVSSGNWFTEKDFVLTGDWNQ